MSNFDDTQLSWSRLGDDPMFDHVLFHALAVDEERNHVEFLAKFDANEMIILHRHLADTHTLVVAGDHVLYEKDRSERDSRPAGRATTSPAGDMHREGGGAMATRPGGGHSTRSLRQRVGRMGIGRPLRSRRSTRRIPGAGRKGDLGPGHHFGPGARLPACGHGLYSSERRCSCLWLAATMAVPP